MAIKKLINNQPNSGDINTLYNFNDNEVDLSYENSTGIPKNNDKFTKKDLYTKTKGDSLNEFIINYNIKFEGGSFIRIDSLRIENSGVDYDIRGIDIKGYIFSSKYYRDSNGGSSIDGKSYDDISPPAFSQFFRYQPGTVAEGNSIGNLDFLQGVDLVKNLSNVDSFANEVEIGDFANSDSNFNPILTLTKEEDPDTHNTAVFDENEYNPIYIMIYMKGDADRWWGSDKRERKYQIFRIENQELFTFDGNNVEGKSDTYNNISNRQEVGNGGSGGAEKAAWTVTDLKVTISTIAGGTNDNITDDLSTITPLVQPPTRYDVNSLDFKSFLTIGPDRQLFNNDSAGSNANNRFKDYIAIARIGVVDKYTNDLSLAYSDLQSYYNKEDYGFYKTSAPATITPKLEFASPTDVDPNGEPTPINSLNVFNYFVISWDDEDDEIKTLQDFLIKRPSNFIDLLNLKEEGLYDIGQQTHLNGVVNYITNPLTHTYNTPGIKNLKIVTFTTNTVNNITEVGRWKLITSRFYLDIPLNEFPDFSELGGSDYTTIPWPYLTPIIGGVDENSNYKISVQNTLSSGNLRDSDLIAERLLVNDLENDEMGKSVKVMDLEQCRYFNKNYNMSNLLGINPITEEGFNPYNDFDYWEATTPERTYPMENLAEQIFINDNQQEEFKNSCKLELNTGELTKNTVYDSSGNSNKGLLMGDFKIKKQSKTEQMRRDSFIKVPKKTNNSKGAL